MEIDRSKWLVFYPLYIDTKFSREQGRKTDKEHSCEQPDLSVVIKIFQELKIECVPEPNKKHPADFFSQGRIRYRLKDEQGNFFNSEIQTRKQLIKKIGEKMPKTKMVTSQVTAVKKVKKNKRRK